MKRRSSILPADQLASVVMALYDDADRAGWDTMAPADRSRTYTQWVEDPRVGGILARYMSPENARAWIKDGPMKEYGRASRGAGRYAQFGRQGGTGPTEVTRTALGATAEVVPGTEGVKPFHCLGRTSAGDVAFIAWGEARNFRDLVWAALRASVQDSVPAHIVVVEPPGLVTLSADVKIQQAIANRCGMTLHHMREVLGSRPSGEAP
jgi:hypothetical protein